MDEIKLHLRNHAGSFSAGDRKHFLLSPPKTIIAIYAKPSVLTGQVAATLTLLEILRAQNWQIRSLHTPALGRGAKYRILAKLSYALHLLLCWLKAPYLLFARPDYVYLNTGQSKVSLIRDLIPFRILTCFSRAKSIISLHGSVFMSWDPEFTEFKLFRALVKTADAVTVLGLSQKQKLIELGIPAEKVVILPNTCDLPPVQGGNLVPKFDDTGPFHILYLSNLIDSKGYPAFLEAMEVISQHSSQPVQITLCGKLHQSDFGARFQSPAEATAWIETRLANIRQNPSFQINWVKGAYGDDKQTLFRQAHVFVFPSQYAVEAQPIVLLEAMASGTAIITSNVGEIPETVRDAAIILDEVSPEQIAQEAQALIETPKQAQALATSGLTLFQSRYSREKHAEMWMELFDKLSKL